jgi:hypothetical protein
VVLIATSTMVSLVNLVVHSGFTDIRLLPCTPIWEISKSNYFVNKHLLLVRYLPFANILAYHLIRMKTISRRSYEHRD